MTIDDPSNPVCEFCGQDKAPDETGELRCGPCDRTTDDIMAAEWEDAIADGQAEVWWNEPPEAESMAEAVGDLWEEQR